MLLPTIDDLDEAVLDDTLLTVEQVTAIGSLVTTLEQFAITEEYEEDQLLSWNVARTRHAALLGRFGDLVAPIMEPPGLKVLLGARLLAALTLLSRSAGRWPRFAALALLTSTNMLLHVRTPYGSDGSEHLATITLTASSLARLFDDDPRTRDACVRFIAGQSALSYGAAGLAKAVSPPWRDGTAVRDVVRTRMYGHRETYELLSEHPRLVKLLGPGTILGELAFPAVLVAPKPIARLLLAVGASFHAGNAVVMGLNRFVWSFIGTYPAIAYAAKNLSPINRGATV